MKKILTIGTFDLFHRGHLNLLRRGAELGELHVGVNSDEFVEAYKGAAPIHSETWRMELLAQLPCVYATWLNDGPGGDLVRLVEPDMLVVGSDWFGRSYLKQICMTQDELFELGCALTYLPRTPGVSTSQLKAAIAA